MTPCQHRSPKRISAKTCFCRHPEVTKPHKAKSLPVLLAQCDRCPYSDAPPRADVKTVIPETKSVDVAILQKAMAGGVGTELIKVNAKSGVKSCQECYETAIRMNELGPDGCREQMDQLVAEILPRAKVWSRKRVFGWFVPDHLLRGEIQKRIEQAIEATGIRETSQTSTNMSGKTSTGLG